MRTALTKLVGKTYLFKIIIDRNNYQYKDDTFKVAKFITSPYMMNEFDVSPYPKVRKFRFTLIMYVDPIPLFIHFYASSIL